MRKAWTSKDRSALAVQSIEAYRLLREALARAPRAVPVQVAQLDYVGFKVNALLASSPLLAMKESTDRKDAKVMHFAADMELILVDGLETFFLVHPRSR